MAQTERGAPRFSDTYLHKKFKIEIGMFFDMVDSLSVLS